MLMVSFVILSPRAHAVNLFLRAGSSTCLYGATTSQTLQKTSGTNQTSIAFSAQTNTFSFYSTPLTNAVLIPSNKMAGGTIGVQNNGSADFQFNVSEILYDYDPQTGYQTQIVAVPATGGPTSVNKNGKSGRQTLAQFKVGTSHTVPTNHMLRVDITITVNLTSGINGALIYNAPGGKGKSVAQLPTDNSINWPFGPFATTPNATITVPSSVQQNSTGNVASVANAGAGAIYAWSITNGTITAGQSTPQVTWTAGASGSVGLGVSIVNGCFSSSGAATVALDVKSNQTVTFNPIPTQTYGNSPITLVATTSSGLPVTFSIVSGPATVSGSTLTITGAGTVVVNANQAGNAGYNPAVVEQSFNVNPAVLSVSGIAAIDKVYDSTATAVLDTSSAVLVGVVSGDSVALDFTFVAGYFADGNVGSGRTVQISGLDINGADAGNYTLVAPTTTASITAAPLTITAVADSKTYDSTTTSSATPTVAGLQGSDTVTGLVQTYDTPDAGTGKTLNVSAYLVNDGNNGANYTVGTVSSSSGVINPVILTVTANNQVRMCGQPNPVLTASYSGFINGEDASVLTTTATLSTAATISSAPGSYPITAGSATAVNYTMNYVSGTLVVAQPLQLSCTSVTVNGTTECVVSWPTLTGQNYQLERITDLATPTWTPVGSLLPGTGGMIAVTNDMSGSPQGFFRVKVQ